MRRIISCRDCKRQYDATGREVGSRFRCHCGSVMQVQSAQGHDAKVVRCDSCGAPREEGATQCPSCESDFTLHERDLHTVCPECLSRVSDRAKFCHHCGVPLVPESAAGDPTQFVCPACEENPHLSSRRLGAEAVTVLECNLCAGLWLGNQAFAQLTQRVGRQARTEDARFGGARRPAPVRAVETPDGRWKYRKCPVCSRLMQRRNYDHHSGVIVDVCGNDGIWFDAAELPRILAWIRADGRVKAYGNTGRPTGDDPGAPATHRQPAAPAVAVPTPEGDLVEDMLGEVAGLLTRIFWR